MFENQNLELKEVWRDDYLKIICGLANSEGGTVLLALFSIRLRIWNPGILIEPLNAENLKKIHPSLRRNPLIANLFFRAGLIEIWGKGTLTIIEEAIKAGQKEPLFREVLSGVELVFNKDLFTPQDTPQDIGDLTGLEYRILGLIKDNDQISRQELSEKLSIGADTVKEYIKRLRVKGYLRRSGGNTSAGFWEIDQKNRNGKNKI